MVSWSDSSTSSSDDSTGDSELDPSINPDVPQETIAQLDAPTKIFEQSMTAFRNSLPPEHQAQLVQCNSVDSLLISIETIAYQFKDRSKISRLLTCCKSLQRFAQSWEPFFEVTAIFVSSNPEYAALAWGAIRLIFQLGSNFVGFLEKLTSMFEHIQSTLSLYHRNIESIRQSVHQQDGSHLSKALSYIYTDIMDFCQQASAVFLQKKSAAVFRSLRTANSMLWKPFDSRFKETLDRLSIHQKIFEGELDLHYQNMLQRHFRNLDIETQNYKKRQEESMKKQKKMTDHKKRRKEQRNKRRDAEEKRAAREELKQRIRDIKVWLDMPSYMKTFENARRTRYSGTCTWLLQDPSYISWRDRSEMRDNSISSPFALRLLVLEAKPGYGKTILSVAAIENIKASKPPQTYVAFFHFEIDDDGKRNHFNAWRAIVAELLNEIKNDQDMIDTVLLLMDENGTGQLHASDNEVEELLSIMLHKYSVVLVFDGVDECQDTDSFLRSLLDITASTDTKLLLLSRPISFPWSLANSKDAAWRLHLESSRNHDDIRKFLESHISRLIDAGLVGRHDSLSCLLDEISARSDGMFLWARMMVNYVSCPVLTPAERIQILRETTMLEGLEKLYERILQVIGSKYLREREVVFKVLHWILVAYRRMTLGEMRIMLAIKPGIPTSDDSYLVDFERSLSVASLGLIEVNAGQVQFIHTSACEFLSSGDLSNTTFRLERNKADLSLASACLSYLIYDMPSMPLSSFSNVAVNQLPQSGFSLPEVRLRVPKGMDTLQGSSALHNSSSSISDLQKLTFSVATKSNQGSNIAPSIFASLRSQNGYAPPAIPRHEYLMFKMSKLEQGTPTWTRAAEIEERFPLIRYAGHFWALHAHRSVSNHQLPLTYNEFTSCQPFLDLLSTFLLDHFHFTMWVEGCALNGFIPNIRWLIDPLARLGHHHLPPGARQREFLWMVAGLRQLHNALDQLVQKHFWGLIVEPACIWGEGISESIDPEFWPRWSPRKENKEKDEDEDGMGVRVEDGGMPSYVTSH